MQLMTRMMLLGLLVGAAACTDYSSATDLNPDGPPMLRQVRLNNRVFDAQNPSVSFPRRVFAFGTHELASPDEIDDNVSAAIVVNNTMRLIVDELLVGNNLEEIACRLSPHDPATGRTDLFQSVPLGSTPDDIKRCAVADDVLFSSCQGNTAVCICENPAGCTTAKACNDSDPMIPKCSPGSTCNNGTCLIATGQSVGVLDQNQDGATDDTRFIDGAVTLTCGSINVPVDLDNSYWNPSGTQNKPAMGGFDALGPAVVFAPNGFMGNHAMPTNLDCHIDFAENIVDKSGIRICAPPNGDIKQNCTPGDVSAFGFKTEALALTPASWVNGETGVSRTDDALFSSNAPLSTPGMATVTMKEGGAGGTNFTAFTVKLMMPQLFQLTYTGAGLKASTEYEVTFTPALQDSWAQPLPAPQIFTFTTGP